MYKQSKFSVMLVVAVLLLGMLAVNKTQAWLFAKTEQRSNQFTVGTVTHEIEEEFDTSVKTNVRVRNTGNTEAYIRVKLIPQWLDNTGNTVGLVTDNTFDITFNTDGWFEQDGFWYYRQPVAAGAESAVLVKSAKPKVDLANSYKGKVFNLQVITQSVQATPVEAVKELWGFEPQ